MLPTDVVILAGARTPMSRYTGAFKDVSAIDLGASASREAIRRSGVDPAEFEHVVFGNVMQTSGDALYGARHVGLKAGLKDENHPSVTSTVFFESSEKSWMVVMRISSGFA